METAAQLGKTCCSAFWGERSWENNASDTHQGNLRFGKQNIVVAVASPQLLWQEGRPCLRDTCNPALLMTPTIQLFSDFSVGDAGIH